MTTNSIPPTEDSQICDISNTNFNETVETDTLSQPPYFSRIMKTVKEEYKTIWFIRLFRNFIK